MDFTDDAIVRAEEFGRRIRNDTFMKEVLYGYPNDDKHIVGKFGEPILFAGDAGEEGDAEERKCQGEVSEVPSCAERGYMGQVSGTDYDPLRMRIRQVHGTRSVTDAMCVAVNNENDLWEETETSHGPTP